MATDDLSKRNQVEDKENRAIVENCGKWDLGFLYLLHDETYCYQALPYFESGNTKEHCDSLGYQVKLSLFCYHEENMSQNSVLTTAYSSINN